MKATKDVLGITRLSTLCLIPGATCGHVTDTGDKTGIGASTSRGHLDVNGNLAFEGNNTVDKGMNWDELLIKG